MAVTLAALVARLQAAVPAKDGVPATADYSRHVQDAVLQLSQDAPLRKTGTLAVVSGTADYALPADFLFLIEWPSLLTEDGVIINEAGIIPLPDAWEETVDVAGATLTIDPEPGYTLSRTFRYAALHAQTGGAGSDTYATLTETTARVALLYAQHLALTQQAVNVSGNNWRYQIGDEMVDKSRQFEGYRAAIETALTSYRQAVQALKGY